MDRATRRRPDFAEAFAPNLAEQLFTELVACCETLGLAQLGFGIFGANMQVSLVNDSSVSFGLGEAHEAPFAVWLQETDMERVACFVKCR